MMKNKKLTETIEQTSRLKYIVDHKETHGRHIVKKVIQNIDPKSCLDIGAGKGLDLSMVKKYSPNCELNALDFQLRNQYLMDLGANIFKIDLEKEELPFKDNSLDFIIANQVLEHVKEIYWINHQIFKKLKKGGYFLIGVLICLHCIIGFIFVYFIQHKNDFSAHKSYSVKDTSIFIIILDINL